MVTSRIRQSILVGALAASLITVNLSAADPAVSPPDPGNPRGRIVEPHRPNIVLILTDDQRRDTLRYMPIVRRLLVRHGVTFTNGYVVNPVCCPSRTSILTGLYSHSTGVYTNQRPDGGFYAFRDDDSTIATWLQAAGYRTGLFGKYLNQYGRDPYVPPGWDRWFATFENGAYYDYEAISNSTVRQYDSDLSSYGTTVLRDQAVSFIRRTDPSTPLFVYWAPHAPHEPATPHPADRDAFSSLASWRPRNYDEADVGDKPAYVSRLPNVDLDEADEIDRFRRLQLESLQAVDRSVRSIVQALRETDRLRDTMIVFMSDNGMLWGEHRLRGKSVPYEEAVGVPFVVRYDALLAEPREDDHLVLNIDLAPTFAALGGADVPEVEGRSLLPILGAPDSPWRTKFLVEHVAKGVRAAPTFCAVHTDRYVLVRYATGEEELYDLVRDPFQLTNRDEWERYLGVRKSLRSKLRRLCDPLPPGFAF